MSTPADANGFTPHSRSSPYLDVIGPLLSRRNNGRLEFAIEIDERHVNGRGAVHGGVLAGFADVALGYATSGSVDPPLHLSTANLNLDFAGAAKQGSTVIAVVDVMRIGRRLAFANCDLWCEERRVARASAVFANTTPEQSG